MTPEDVKFMFSEMMQRSEQLFFTQTEVIDEKIHSLPSFVEALASIVKEMDEVSRLETWYSDGVIGL
jgi:DNA-dependent protein kinase catalytic subunit